ncbi:MAG: hypothetical protein L0I99_08580, partial [Micrococcaceae bacterium]|nr:hypothetical protein [Micrococcaceae bacterium]
MVNRFQKWLHGSWSIPVASGILILMSFALQYFGAEMWNRAVSPQWWIDAGEHATSTAEVFT